MDEKIINIQTRLNAYKESHPNLHMFWEKYINLKVDNFKKTIEELESVLDSIGSISDINYMNLLTLYCLSS